MRILCIGMARTGRQTHRGHLGFGLFLAIYILALSFHPTTAATDGFNKLFTHNRTGNPFDESADTSFLTRLRDLTAASKNPSPSPGRHPNLPIPAKLKGANNKQPQFQQNGKGKNKKNKGNGRKPKPSTNHNQNPNHNYYSSSYAIPKYQNVETSTVFTPTVAPTRIHPLAVLKTEIKGQPEGVTNFGRSALDDFTEQDDQEGRSSEVLSGPAAADTNYFKNFRDHSEDPMAEESAGPVPAYARPSDQRQPFSPISAPSAPQFGHQIKGQFSEMSPVGYNQGGHQGQSYPDHKNVNYWPQKLNSYYGDEYLSQLHPNKKPPRSDYPIPHHHQHQVSSFEEYGDEAAGTTNALQKVTMIDRISTFYTDYKFLAWVGIVVLVSLAALFGLLVLYWRNPPTEVVTARDNLSRRLTDPTLLIFVSEALRKFGDKEKIEEKPGGTNRPKRRRPKNPSV